MQERLAGCEAVSVASRGTSVGGRTVVVEALEDWDAAGLKSLASAIAKIPGHDAALFSTTSPVLVAIACAPGGAADAAAVLKVLVGRFGGKGGGKRDLAQGGGLTGNVAEILAVARAALTGQG
jgi:alanyl-tRNA synthetase